MVDAAKQSVQEWSRDAADTVAAAGASVGNAVKEQAESIAAGARRARDDLTNQAANVGSRVSAATESGGAERQASCVRPVGSSRTGRVAGLEYKPAGWAPDAGLQPRLHPQRATR